ncbi:hypothetical protein [Streptosporangium sp. NPDC003464]
MNGVGLLRRRTRIGAVVARWATAITLVVSAPAVLAPSPAAAIDDGTLCGVAPDQGNVILRYTGTPGQWTRIGNPPAMLYGNESALLATNPVTGDVFEHLAGSDWRWIGYPGRFALVGSTVYGMPHDQSVIMRFNGVPGNWTAVGGSTVGLAGGGSRGPISTQPGTYAAYLYTGVPYVWTPLGRPPGNGPVVYASAGNDVFAAAKGQGIFIRDWSYNTWVRVDAPGLGFDDGVMVIGDLGVFATTGNNLGDLYQYMYTPGVWRRIGQAGFDYVVTGRTVYRQNHNNEVYKYSGTPNVWTKIHNNLVLITHCPTS